MILFGIKSVRNLIAHEITNFYDKEITKLDSNHTCLVVISLDSAVEKDENCYLQIFFERV